MNFLNPAILFGLIAAAIPLLLHLFNLRKLKNINFSTLHFLKEMQKSKIKSIKIKQLLLLVLRTLIIVFIILAFARPTIDGTIPGFENFAKTSSIIIIDNSFSLDLSDEYGNRFNQEKKIVRELLNSMQEGDEAVIVEMSNQTLNKEYKFSRNKEYLQTQLDNIKINYIPADLNKSINYINKLIKEAVNFSKEIYIITDAQRNIFSKSNIEKIKIPHTNVYFLAIGYNNKNEIKNNSIDSISILTQIFQINKPVEIETHIKNNSKYETNNLLVEMKFNNNRVTQRTVDLQPEQIKTVPISAIPNKSGAYISSIEIENDVFDNDNKRFFGFTIPEKPKAAVFSKDKDELFINSAISAVSLPNSKEPFANINMFYSNELSSVDLTQFDLLILASGKFTNQDFNRLSQYISSGGNALIFANSTTEISIFTTALNNLGFGNTKIEKYSDNSPAKFTNIDKRHPLFDGVFQQDNNYNNVVESPNIYKLLANTQGQSLIDIGNIKFLSESILGDGKIIYCAVPPSMEWSNFPITGMFPTIITRSISYLSSHSTLSYNFELGDNCQIMIPKKDCIGENVRIVDPNGNEFLRQIAILPSGGILQLNDINQVGVYSIYNSNNKLIALVACNLSCSESDFSKINSSQIQDSLETRFIDASSINFITELDNITNNINRIRTGTELWRLCLLLALICAIAEMLIQKNYKTE
ncbi:MAG: BatA domain-containing protein [Bacteroidetes bacterium]|nr:BatA domain-containing protein [Bacteroidota bacterium]